MSEFFYFSWFLPVKLTDFGPVVSLNVLFIIAFNTEKKVLDWYHRWPQLWHYILLFCSSMNNLWKTSNLSKKNQCKFADGSRRSICCCDGCCYWKFIILWTIQCEKHIKFWSFCYEPDAYLIKVDRIFFNLTKVNFKPSLV